MNLTIVEFKAIVLPFLLLMLHMNLTIVEFKDVTVAPAICAADYMNLTIVEFKDSLFLCLYQLTLLYESYHSGI